MSETEKEGKDLKTKKTSTATSRSEKSKETKRKIVEATAKILKKDGYENLTIRNIVAASGVSNGTLYHFFSSKDDILSELLRSPGGWDQGLPDEDSSQEELLESIETMYLRFFDSFLSPGAEFVANYFTPKNQAFNVYSRKQEDLPETSLRRRLVKARENRIISSDISIDQVVVDLRIIIFGIFFEWSVTQASIDATGLFSRLYRSYMMHNVFQRT